MSPAAIDHIVYMTANLERGMSEIEALLGTRPVHGGRHPRYGTHNALLSLGPGTYLEIMARDPGLAAPEGGALVKLAGGQKSHLKTWVIRAENIDELANAARLAGIAIGSVQSGRRENPDGSTLQWQLTDPYALPMGGAIPFLISWGETPHPAGAVPRAGELLSLTIEHPEASRVRECMDVLESNVDVVQAERFKLIARIRTADGIRTLE